MVFLTREGRGAMHTARLERESSAVASSLKTELFLPLSHLSKRGRLFARLEQVMGEMSTCPVFLSCDIEAFFFSVWFEARVHCVCNKSHTQNHHRRMSAWPFDFKVDCETIKL